MRKIYLDNIRQITVILVLIYHVFYIFNGVGVPGAIPDMPNIYAFDVMACVIYPWFMVLLFLIAGISARYSLQKRTAGQFLKERACRLLIPSTLGLFVIHWITGYLNIRLGGGLAYLPAALVYPVSAISGIGPLWFIQMLFLFSCILVLLKKMDKKDRIWALCQKVSLPVLLLLFLPLFGASQILNLPVLTMYRFGIYFTAFLTGYYIFSHEEAWERAEKIRIPMACLAAAGAIFYGIYYGGSDYTSPACLQSLFTNLYLWAVILAVAGCGRKYLNRENAFTRYMAGAGFGIYILHYPVLLLSGTILHDCFALPAIWNYLITLIAEITGAFALYETIRRIPVVRFLVLGIRR